MSGVLLKIRLTSHIANFSYRLHKTGSDRIHLYYYGKGCKMLLDLQAWMICSTQSRQKMFRYDDKLASTC